MQDTQMAVDEQGTSQEHARHMLRRMCNEGFNGSIDDTSIVLGRSPAEIEQHLNGEAEIDDDMVMKMRGIAQHRGINLD